MRKLNFYGTDERNVTPYGQKVEDNVIHELVAELEASSDYRRRREAVRAFNGTSPVLRKGMALTPVKFGISFNMVQLNQAGALVHVYTDGSVLVNHGGTEMGQGLNTKVAQVVAHELGISLKHVRAAAADTSKVPNTSATAASTGADLNGKAGQDAARQIRARLAQFAAETYGGSPEDVCFANDTVTVTGHSVAFADLVQEAHNARVQLWSDGHYATPKIHWDQLTLNGRPFFYYAYGAAVSEVIVDTLTGEWKLVRADLLHDAGNSHQPRHRHRPDRGRLHPGHGMAHPRRAVVEHGRQADDVCTLHLQDSHGERLPSGLPRAPVQERQPRGYHPALQGSRRTATAPVILGVLCDPRCGGEHSELPGQPTA